MTLKYRTRHDSCIGCGISAKAGCLVIEYFTDDSQCRKFCPCSECLVKPTCDRYCDKRMKLYNNINKELGNLRDIKRKK